MIGRLIDAFYARARADPTLGPIFERIIGDDWTHHLGKMRDFWSAVTLGTRRFRGSPMAAHVRIPELRATHFGRWLYLFRLTAREVCPPEAAALFIAKAEMIAESLELALASARGELPPVLAAHQRESSK